MRYQSSISTFLLIASISLVAQAQRPNVILIITDDQGYGDLSCHGNPVLKTPHLDKLYDESIRLTDYHVSPTCSPTRAALLTGHWTNRTGVWHTIMGRSILREDEVTMGKVFQDAGYATGMFGKWHLGDNYPFRPEDRGFGEVMRHGGGGVGQTPDYWDNAYFDGAYFHNSQPKPVEGFCTDVFFDYAKRFIADQAEKKQTFFAYIATNAPHGPMHAPEASSKPYEDQGKQVANFLGMIANIDDNVGALRDFLDEKDLADNTIFIFTTDNGTAAGRQIFNAGMRGQKGSEYDGGHRVPFFVHWPGGNLHEGRDVTPLTAHVDILPTLIEMCDLEAPQGVTFDGTSIKSMLDGSSDSKWDERILVTDSQRVKDPIKWRKSAVMTSRWRLVNQTQLFDMKHDPSQTTDVAAEHPAVVERLTTFYNDWWRELEPTFEQDAMIYIGHPAENPATLTSHDWITTGSTPWNQSHIRRAIGEETNTGFWNVHVYSEGEYQIRLRRWPIEADRAIDADLVAGRLVPGAKPYRATPGISFAAVKAALEISGQEYQIDVTSGSKEAIFNIRLPSGPTRLTGSFIDADGNTIGAYYAYVERQSDN